MISLLYSSVAVIYLSLFSPRVLEYIGGSYFVSVFLTCKCCRHVCGTFDAFALSRIHARTALATFKDAPTVNEDDARRYHTLPLRTIPLPNATSSLFRCMHSQVYATVNSVVELMNKLAPPATPGENRTLSEWFLRSFTTIYIRMYVCFFVSPLVSRSFFCRFRLVWVYYC